MQGRIRKIWIFLTNDIWRITEEEVKPSTLSIYDIIKTIIICIKGISRERLTNKAAALTYSTILAIVPLLAVLFAIARGFGFDNIMKKQLVVGMGGQEDVVTYILEFVNSYLQQSKDGLFIGVGLIALLWTILNLISNMEVTFNSIWGIKRERSMFRKITDFFSMLLLIPFFIIVSAGLSIYIGTIAKDAEGFILLAPIMKFLIRLIPFAFTWLIFTALYMFIPNTKVHFKNALVSGIIAGTAHQVLQYMYISGQLYVTKYNAIYGSFAAFPLFLIWLQISWTICLFGAQLTYSGQNIKYYSFDKDIKNISRRYRDFVTVLIMTAVCKRFVKGKKPLSAEDISEHCTVPIKLSNSIIDDLHKKGLLNIVVIDEKAETVGYQPAIDISLITLGYLMKKLDISGSENFKIDIEGEFRAEWETIVNMENNMYMDGEKVLLKDL